MDPARGRPSDGLDARGNGRALFLREDCGDYHRVQGTKAQGASGPDLSHIGSRMTLGAGWIENDTQTMARFIAHSSSIKPGSQMPAYLRLSADDLQQIAAWLKGLQ